jgi:hypothetical protein
LFCSRFLKISSCAMLFLLLAVQLLHGQGKSAAEYQVKAVFLYNFTQFIDWPPSTFNSADEPFVIGIIGEDPFGSYLDEVVAGENIGTHPIMVKRYKTIKDIGNCKMLFINTNDGEWAEKILESVSRKNILTVSDKADFIKWGGIVRFYTDENKIRLQINVEKAKAAQLNISSKLLSVAKTH